MLALVLVLSAFVAHGRPCCQKCEAPLKKYYSVDVPHGFCGEACMDPARIRLFKRFEANLTLVEEGTDHGSCVTQFAPDGSKFTDYANTVTHGIPGLLSVTLDLYAPTDMPQHDCCVTPLFQSLHCFGIPGKGKPLSIRGTGPYCCPGYSTEEIPCATTIMM
eukprot:TRINITY_DN49538_c0_g1_i1.p1 TRINITY_DN49538_c0_g1~~TRINITY_DN49538_c0_g1_i1.p1  ORF type:complete len:175 (-),score=14.83 TRINITY_DN49538_c0_g1_i1:66-551(-)